MQAKDIMHTNVIIGRPESQVKHLVSLMLEYDVSMIPIVDDNKTVVGVVTEGDIIYRAYNEVDNVDVGIGFIHKLRELLKAMGKRSGNLASEVMSEDIISASADSSIAEIAKLMVEKKIKNVPILEKNNLIGLVTRRDVMRLVLEGKV